MFLQGLTAVALVVLTIPGSSAGSGAPVLAAADVTVGRNLEAPAAVTLNGPAPQGGVLITLTSSDPSRLLLSRSPEEAGLKSITVPIHEGLKATPEFYVQGLDDHGTVTYTASAPDLERVEATVTLAPSAIAIVGPHGVGSEDSTFQTTIRSRKWRVTVFTMLLGSKGVVSQAVAGGSDVKVNVANSNSEAGTISSSSVIIGRGTSRTTLEFQPVALGKTTLSPVAPHGFSTADRFAQITAIVDVPGLAVSGGGSIGQNLQLPCSVNLGAFAPEGGLDVTLTSADPKQLLVSAKETDTGSKSATLHVPAGATNAQFYVQALGGSGTAAFTASAPGYGSRTATDRLTPSGVVLVGPLTLPEAQVLRPQSEGGAKQHGFVAYLSSGKVTPLTVYTVQLNPVTLRSADITVQQLRPGLSLTVDLKNADSTIGTIASRVVIKGGSDHADTEFRPTGVGETILSVVTPVGFTTSANDSSLKTIVKP